MSQVTGEVIISIVIILAWAYIVGKYRGQITLIIP